MTRDPAPRTRRRRGRWQRLRRTLRRRASRASLGDLLGTLIWVTPLTLLIWAVAEREQTDAVQLRTSLGVQSDDVTRSVTLPDGKPVLRLDLEGPRGGLATVRQLLDVAGTGELKLPVPPALPPGEHQIDVAQGLSDLAAFREAGVSVDAARPASVRVVIDAKAERQFDVRLRGGEEIDPTLRASFEPSTVAVVGPSSLIGAEGVVAVAELADRERPEPGRQRRLAAVPVRLVGADGEPIRQPEIVVEPPAVAATLRRVPAEERETLIRTMPLRVSKPANAEGRWRVEPAAVVVNNVTVRGPAQQIAAIERGTRPVAATLRVPGDAVPGVRAREPVDIDLPPDVEIVGDPPSVEYVVESVAE